ncbi:hypothetical protein [Kordiimonas aestuarii]|uniref:hypothetical protein n=1 Tax=Kordiimonas aestuarii TaxID=1005925 RepID=UPI0021D142D1|nr:hypothetical protein [Kordiimonas aestuarii]
MRMLIMLLFAVLLALPAQAQVPKRASKDYAITHRMRNVEDTRIQPYAGLELSGSFKVWYLLGEPVVNCTARWTNPGVLQVILDDGTRILSEPGEEEMWNLMLMAQFPNPDKQARRLTNGGGAHLSVFCDAGVVAQNGKNGFNVAGSPNWDKFICATPKKVDTRDMFDIDREQKDQCASVGGDWLSPADAKKAAIAGLSIDEVMVLSVELSAGETLRRAEKMLWRQKSFAFKQSRASAMLSRLSQKNQPAAIGFAQRQYDLNSKASKPSQQDLKNYDAFISQLQTALGETGPTREWRDKQQALVGAQLERVADIDRALKAREAELVAYRNILTEMAKNAPEGPTNPLEEYIVEEHTLTTFTKPYSGDHGLKNKSGHVVVEPKQGRYKPLVGKSGTKYDFYIGDMDNFSKTYWVIDKHGRKLGLDLYRGYPRFHEDLGLISFAIGDRHSRRAYLSVYSLAEKRVLFHSEQTPISDTYRNKQQVRTRGERGEANTWTRDYNMDISRTMIEGRFVIYGFTNGLYPYRFENECTAKTEKGEEQGVMPAFMFDLEANRLLRPSEHLCVPNPSTDWHN